MTAEDEDLPSTSDIEKLDKGKLDGLLAEVCMRLYDLMGRETYDRIILRSVARLQRGVKPYVEFVKWAVNVLRSWPKPVTLFE